MQAIIAVRKHDRAQLHRTFGGADAGLAVADEHVGEGHRSGVLQQDAIGGLLDEAVGEGGRAAGVERQPIPRAGVTSEDDRFIHGAAGQQHAPYRQPRAVHAANADPRRDGQHRSLVELDRAADHVVEFGKLVPGSAARRGIGTVDLDVIVGVAGVRDDAVGRQIRSRGDHGRPRVLLAFPADLVAWPQHGFPAVAQPEGAAVSRTPGNDQVVEDRVDAVDKTDASLRRRSDRQRCGQIQVRDGSQVQSVVAVLDDDVAIEESRGNVTALYPGRTHPGDRRAAEFDLSS